MEKDIKNNSNENFNNDAINKEMKKLEIKIYVFLGISYLLLIITLFNISRISMFSNVFGSLMINVKYLGLIIYIISLSFMFLYYNSLFILYILYKYIRKENWYSKLSFYDKKLDLISFIFKCFSILLFLLIFIFTPCVVSGQSMADTLTDGDTLLCSNLLLSPNKGDIIVFDSHDYVSSESDNHSFYIKRVVATKNDVLKYDDAFDILYINGEEVNNFEGVLDNDTQWHNIINSINKITNQYESIDGVFEISIPKGYLLVFGDNRNNSNDSRIFGVISEKDVFGKAILRLFPFSKFKVL